jgi:hypothetical protein
LKKLAEFHEIQYARLKQLAEFPEIRYAGLNQLAEFYEHWYDLLVISVQLVLDTAKSVSK